MRAGIRWAAAAVGVLALVLPVAAPAADPVAIVMQQAIRRALQAQLNAKAPGMKVTAVTCTVSKDGRRGTCKASFAYSGITGFYMLKVVQPAKGKPSFTSMSVTCFDRSGHRTRCNG